MGKVGFNYLIIVCARAEERSPKTFPGVGMTFSWIFEDPRREEDLPYDSILERFRAVRDQIELRGRLEHPEEGLRRLREKRERERLEAWKPSGARSPFPTAATGGQTPLPAPEVLTDVLKQAPRSEDPRIPTVLGRAYANFGELRKGEVRRTLLPKLFGK
jgi:hypothetical protein